MSHNKNLKRASSITRASTLRLDPSLTAPAFSPEEELGLAPAEPQADLKLATEYLHRFYKLQKDPSGRMRRSGPSFTSKVKDMQTFFGLNSTGELDSGTLEVMRSPRCGVPDVEEYSHIHGTRWNKNVIAYSIGRYTRDLPSSTVDFLIESAFGVWAKASGLTFVRSHTHNTDIMVEFVTYGRFICLAHSHKITENHPPAEVLCKCTALWL
nr:stromelysin-2 [Nothobranchius furzeri]